MSFELRSADGKIYKITKEFTTLGRSSENDIVIPDNAISRTHINFFIKDGQLIVEDAGSQNGFLLNGEVAISAKALQAGDKITLGRKTYVAVPAGYSGKVSFTLPKEKKKSKGAHTQSIEIKGVPQLQNKRIFIYGALGIFLLFIAMGGGSDESTVKDRNRLEEALAPLPNEGYKEQDPVQKTPNQLMGESKLQEAIRDYYNNNYSRAIAGFQSALTLDPSNDNARSFLQRSMSQLKFQIEDLVFHADKAFRLQHFRKAKALSVKALNIMTERTPGYVRKIAQQNAGLEDNRPAINQELNLKELPCEKTQHPELCQKAMTMMKRSRTLLGEENVLK